MSLGKVGGALLGVVVVVGLVYAAAPNDVLASDRGTLEERRAQREAEREARRTQREADRAQRDAEREERRAARDAEKEEQEANCGCSASVKFARPGLQFQGNALVFVPRVDVTVRTRGVSSGPDWSANLVYDGNVSFASEDMVSPSDVLFSGSRGVASGSCGSNRYTFRGLALDPISLSVVTRSLLGDREELDGAVRMQARIEGCGFDEERRMFGFTIKELGNLRVRNWRSWR